MYKINKWLLSLLLSIVAANLVDAQTLKREFRSVWIATVANIDWPKTKGSSASVISSQKSDLIAYLDKMEEMNLTTVCFQVRSMCDAMYKSSYEPWSSYLTGTRGLDPGWDPLAFVVEECHKRGLEVYAWVNPYRWASSGSENTWNTDFDNQLKSDGLLLTNGKFTVLNPAFDSTREHIVKVCREIITNYGVEGMIFDDYFYPTGGTSEDSSAPDYSIWKNSGTSLAIGDWRRENVDKMVRAVYDMVQEVRPEVRFGIAPPGTAGQSAGKYGLSIWPNGYDTQYTSLYSDPLSWMDKGIIDFVSPQVYWHNDHSLAPFGTISNWWYGLAAHFKNCHCSISVNIYDLAQSMGYQQELGNTQQHWQEHVDNVLQSREFAQANGVKAFGSNFYSIQYFTGSYEEHADYIKDNCFVQKALVPVVDWKDAPRYGAVAGLSYKDGALSWTGIDAGLSTMRYTVYAIPKSMSIDVAKTGDGFDASHLLGITYSPSYIVPEAKQTGYWYAVCVYDGYGYEYDASVVEYPEDNYAQKAQLISPVENAQVKDNITFSWKNDDEQVSSFTLQISKDNSFSVIKYSKDVENTGGVQSLEAPASRIGQGVCYWRVVSKGNACFDTPSDYRSFTVTDIGVGNYESGYEIQLDQSAYASVGNVSIENLWFRSVLSGYDNIVFAGQGTYNRSMVAVDDCVYLSGRTENSSTATAFMEKYSALTGEHLGRLTLENAASVSYYPCNNLTKDSKDNVCVSNLIMMQYGPLIVHHVNLETGELTEVARIQSTKLSESRFDHIAIVGDVTTGDFTVIAAAANSNSIARWKFTDGVYTETITKVTAFYPTSATTFGVAPRVMPISETDVFVDGANTALTRYSLADGSRTGSFLANTALAPSGTMENGCTFFVLGNDTYVVYAYDDPFTSPCNTFNVVKTTSELTFSDMSQMWVLPKDGLGAVNNQISNAVADYVKVAPNCVRLFLYIPGNGLCAYDVTDAGISGVGNDVADVVSHPVEYYSLQGVRMNGVRLKPGIYIRKQGHSVTKVIIK